MSESEYSLILKILIQTKSHLGKANTLSKRTALLLSIFGSLIMIKASEEMNTSGKLTNLQIELLKMFNYELPEDQLSDIKKLLGKYFAETASREADKLWDENNWTNDTMEKWAKEHLRKKQQD